MNASRSVHGIASCSGELKLRVIRKGDAPVVQVSDSLLRKLPVKPVSLSSTMETIRLGLPLKSLSDEVRLWKWRNMRHFFSGLRPVLLARHLGISTFYGTLALQKISKWGDITDYGVVGFKSVTTAGAGFIVDAFQNLVELETMKYHGIGTGSTAENITDTALVTELTTEYNPNSTRATGTLTESTAVIFETVATNTLDGTPGAALREHCVFSNATVGSGVALDRTVYAAITLSSADGLASTYDLTIAAGG